MGKLEVYCPTCGKLFSSEDEMFDHHDKVHVQGIKEEPLIEQQPEIKSPTHKRNTAIFTIIVFSIAFLVVAVVLTSFYLPALHVSQTVRIQVSYGGAWQGAYGDVGGIVSWSGNGPYSVTLTRSNQGLWVVSANAQKMDDLPASLTVSIIGSDGHVIKSATTSAAYGMAQVAANIDG